MRDQTRRLSLIGTLILYAVISGCAQDATFDELLLRARDAVDRKDTDAAVIDLKAALQQQPSDARARRLLGEVYLYRQQAKAAADELERSLRSEFDPDTARKFAKALYQAGEHQRVVDLGNELFFLQMRSDGEYLAIKARALGAQGDLEGATEALRQARAASPNNAYVRLTAAEFQASAELDVSGATIALRQLLATHRDMSDAWSVLGSLLLSQGLYENAVTAFTQAVEHNPYRLRDRLNLASVQMQIGDWEAARTQIDVLAQAATDNPIVKYLQARYALRNENTALALDHLNAALAIAPNHTPSLFLAAILNVDNDAYATAVTQLGTLLKQQPRQSQARLVLARVYLQEGNLEQAAKAARTVLKSNDRNPDALTLLGTALALQSAHAEAAEVFTQAAVVDPRSLETRLRLANALIQAKQFDDADRVLDEARALWPEDLRVRVRQVQAQVYSDRLSDARSTALAAVTDFPDDAVAHDLVAQVLLASDDRSGATEAFDRAVELEPEDRVAQNGLSALTMSEDNPGISRRLFQDALAAQPDDLGSVTEIRASDYYRQDFAALEETLRETVAADPDDLTPRLQLAQTALVNNKPGEAAATLAAVQEQHDKDPRLHYILAQALLRTGDLDGARRASDRLIELVPEAPEALRMGAAVATAQGDLEAAESYLRTALSAVDLPALHSALAQVLVRQGKFDDAREEMASMTPEALAAEPMQMLAGALALQQRNFEAARGHYQAAYEAAPATRNVIALAAIDWVEEKPDAALARLDEWLAENPADALVLNQVATYQLTLGREADAAETFESLLAVAPNSALALNNLAWLYRESDSKRALVYVDRALDAAPDVGPILDTKAMILHYAGRGEEALAVMEDAIEASGENPAFMLNKAIILAGVGRGAEARSIVSGLPDEGPSSYVQDLESLRRELGSG